MPVELVQDRHRPQERPGIGIRCDAHELPDLLGGEPPVGWWVGMGVLQQGWSGEAGERLPTTAGPCAVVVSGTSVHGIVGPPDSREPAVWFAGHLNGLQLTTEGTTGTLRKRPRTITVGSAADGWNLTLTAVTRVYRTGPTPRGQSGEEASLVEALAAGGAAFPAQPPAAAPPPPGAGVPPGADRNRRLVGAVVALVVALVAVVGVAAYLLGQNHPTAEAAPPGGGGTAQSTAPQASGHPPVDAPGLLAALPADLSDCETHVHPGTTSVVDAVCGSSASVPGMFGAYFYLYSSKAAMDEQLRQWIDYDHLPSATCGTLATGSHSVWQDKGGTPIGELGCSGDSGQASVFWSDDRYLILADFIQSGNSAADMRAALDWWAANHEYRPGS